MSEALCVEGLLLGSGEGRQDCGSCYLISMGSVVGVFAADILLTTFISVCVFCFAMRHRRRRRRPRDAHEGDGRLPLSVSKKMTTEVTESPYQELRGVQSDIYSDLGHFRK
nr:TYRO protein tyrosine kinase-binding protein [Nothobranchius furzeri]